MITLKKTMVGCVVSAMFSMGFGLSAHAVDLQQVPAATAVDQVWRLPEHPQYPENNKPNADRLSLGEQLFFDPRLSGNKNMSCATCHNPSLGWSDARSTGLGSKDTPMSRASPSIENLGFNTIFMWDGRKATLESQVFGPMESPAIMNSNVTEFLEFLKNNSTYKKSFEKAYPSESINKETVSKAIAAFERDLIVRNTPFDRWLAGDKNALSMAQWRGYQVFQKQGNCVACHSAPNFTDNGFHNIGLAQQASENADVGRYKIRKVAVNQGAFKTPPLRNVEYTAPYFHDGSVKTLEQVVEHYAKGGEVKEHLSPNLHELSLTDENKSDLVAFLKSLSAPLSQTVKVPVLPQ